MPELERQGACQTCTNNFWWAPSQDFDNVRPPTGTAWLHTELSACPSQRYLSTSLGALPRSHEHNRRLPPCRLASGQQRGALLAAPLPWQAVLLHLPGVPVTILLTLPGAPSWLASQLAVPSASFTGGRPVCDVVRAGGCPRYRRPHVLRWPAFPSGSPLHAFACYRRVLPHNSRLLGRTYARTPGPAHRQLPVASRGCH